MHFFKKSFLHTNLLLNVTRLVLRWLNKSSRRNQYYNSYLYNHLERSPVILIIVRGGHNGLGGQVVAHCDHKYIIIVCTSSVHLLQHYLLSIFLSINLETYLKLILIYLSPFLDVKICDISRVE